MIWDTTQSTSYLISPRSWVDCIKLTFKRVEIPGIEPMTPCLVIRQAEHSVNEAVLLPFRDGMSSLSETGIIRSQEKNFNQNRDSNLGPPDF